MLHFKRLDALLARTYIHTVSTAKTVEHINLLNEAHSCKCLSNSRKRFLFCKWRCRHLFRRQHKRTNCCVRANVCTFVTLNTVFSAPFWNKCCHTTFLIAGCTLLPCTVFNTFECRNWQQIAVLRIDWTHNLVDEFRVIVLHHSVVFQIRPCWIDCQCLIFTATVNSGIILVYHILALLAI